MKAIIPEAQHKQRLDNVLVVLFAITRSQAQRLIRRELVLVNGKPAKKTGELVGVGDTIHIQEELKEVVRDEAPPEEIPEIEIIVETPEYLVVNKPVGLLTHRTAAKERVTLASLLAQQFPEIKKVGDNPEDRPGIVHRLDRDASGILVVARTQEMFLHLKLQFQARTIEKEYTVLVEGDVAKDHAMLDWPIDRGSDGRMVARPKTDPTKLKNVRHLLPGKSAETEFWVEKRFRNATLLRVQIHTGRMHQIRVHFLAYNHPVVGDSIYGIKSYVKATRLCLHASRLAFNDLALERVAYEAPLPDELQKIIAALK